MASLTIRNLDESVKKRLRKRAREHGRSMSEEAGEILKRAILAQNEPSLAKAIRAIVEPLGGFEIPEVRDEPLREPPRFDE